MRDESLARCSCLMALAHAVRFSLLKAHWCCCWCRLVLEGPLFGHYFDKVEVSNFEVASDAFSTFKVSACTCCWASGAADELHALQFRQSAELS